MREARTRGAATAVDLVIRGLTASEVALIAEVRDRAAGLNATLDEPARHEWQPVMRVSR